MSDVISKRRELLSEGLDSTQKKVTDSLRRMDSVASETVDDVGKLVKDGYSKVSQLKDDVVKDVKDVKGTLRKEGSKWRSPFTDCTVCVRGPAIDALRCGRFQSVDSYGAIFY